MKKRETARSLIYHKITVWVPCGERNDVSGWVGVGGEGWKTTLQKKRLRGRLAHGPALRHPLEIWGKVVIQFFAGDREPTLLFVNCKWKLNKRQNLTCFVLFLKICCGAKWIGSCVTTRKLCSSRRFSRCWFHKASCDHAPVVIIVLRFIVGYLKLINNLNYLNSLSNCY